VTTQIQTKFSISRQLQHFIILQGTQVGLEQYWHWVIGYWAIFTDIG